MNGKECDYDDLGFDEACLFLNTNDEDYNATLYSLSSDCVLCPFRKVSWIEPGRNTSVKLNTGGAVTWKVYNDSGVNDFRSANDESGIICQFQPTLGEYGIYELTIDDEGCEFDTILEPSNPYIALAVISGVVLCLLCGISIVNIVRKRWKKRTGEESNNQEASTRERVLSIDTFRGISIMMMIFVNNGAGGYEFLEHATWNGLYIGDAVFACFLWIMGFCIPISLSSQFAKGNSRIAISRGILKRSVLLFAIGVALNSLRNSADLETIRIFGVLQRFGVAYLVVSSLYTFLSRRNEVKYENPALLKIADFLSLLPQWIFILFVTAVHCVITFCLPVPGCPTGYLGPGGRHNNGKYFNCTGGATGYVDKLVLGTNHIFTDGKISTVYGSEAFETEGLLGCLPTILQTFIGVQAGKIFKVHEGWKNHTVRWLVLALLCGCLGTGLHFSNIIPINKNLWSLSFVFFTSCLALVLFTTCYLLVDVTSIWRGGPFRIPGMNSLVMFVGHHVCHLMFPFHWKYGDMNNHAWQTVSALWTTAAWTIVGYILHQKKTYITV